MKKSFNFIHLAIFVLGFFVFNLITNFIRRIVPKRASPGIVEPVPQIEPETPIGFGSNQIDEIAENEKRQEIERLVEELLKKRLEQNGNQPEPDPTDN